MLSFSSKLYQLSSAWHLFFNAPSSTKIYSLSLHDALPIYSRINSHQTAARGGRAPRWRPGLRQWLRRRRDRKSTRLNSSHVSISYAVFCSKKKTFFDGTQALQRVLRIRANTVEKMLRVADD